MTDKEYLVNDKMDRRHDLHLHRCDDCARKAQMRPRGMTDKEYLINDKMVDLWMAEFVIPRQHCSICGNHGVIDTRGRVFTPAGVECGNLLFCMCPNGRAMKELGVDITRMSGVQWSSKENALIRRLIQERANHLLAMNRANPEVGFGMSPAFAKQRATEQIKAELEEKGQ